MNPERDAAAVVAGEPPSRVGGEGGENLGIKEPGVVAPTGVAVNASETNGEAKGRVNGGHERNGSLSGAFLAVPGYSPSFASLGDTSSFESRHVPSHSDTFEGFEPPRLSNSPEAHETPKVTRPEGLSFTTPGAGNRTPEITEADTPIPVIAEEGEKQAAEDHISPIANLVDKPADIAAPSSHIPTELKPTLGNVDSFTFNRLSEQSGTPNEPYVTSKKIPGHELLSSFMTTNKASTPSTPEGSQGVNAVSPPVTKASSSAPSHSDVSPSLEAPKEPEPVVMQPGPDAAQGIQPIVDEAPLPEESAVAESVVQQPEPDATQLVEPKIHEAPPPEEPPVAIPAIEKLDSHTTDSPVALAADGSTTEKAVYASNLATGSEGKIEESAGHGIVATDEKEVGSAQPPESIAFRNVEAEKEVPTSTTTETSKPGPFRRITTMATKKWRAPTDAELKAQVVIPEYLSKDMANAVATEGAAVPEGPPPGEKVEAPTCPILVFINSKSGGRLGPELMKHFEELISPNQVYDLANHSPSAVLQYGVGCLDRMANSGDECARRTRESLRILVAGGDGTVGWVLSSVGAIRELSGNSTVPPVGILPLGTGNDLSRSFGWGGDFSSTSKEALKKVLVKVIGCDVSSLDTWNAVVVPAKSVATANIVFPHAMHPQHHIPLPSSVVGDKHDKDQKDPAFEGLFFNYLSVGMDAQVAYGFHHLRDEKPWLARGRAANQMIYGGFGCTQGWFCTACSVSPRARGISNILKLSVRKGVPKIGKTFTFPASRRRKEGFEEQKCDDGLLEIMGLRDGWHSAFVLLEVRTAVRLCQAEAVKIELHGRARKKAYLQMDGEPWMQPMGMPDDEPTVVMIEKLPHPSILLKR